MKINIYSINSDTIVGNLHNHCHQEKLWFRYCQLNPAHKSRVFWLALNMYLPAAETYLEYYQTSMMGFSRKQLMVFIYPRDLFWITNSSDQRRD